MCFETPTNTAKSTAGRPLRRHVSRFNTHRCGETSGGGISSGNGIACPRRAMQDDSTEVARAWHTNSRNRVCPAGSSSGRPFLFLNLNTNLAFPEPSAHP